MPETETNPFEPPFSELLPPAEEAASLEPLRPWGFWTTLGLGIVVAGTFVMAQTGAFLITWFGFPPEDVTIEEHAQDGDILGILTLVSGTTSILVIVLLILLRKMRPDRYLGFRRPNHLWHVALWMLLTAGLGYLHSALAPLAGIESPPQFMILAWESTDSLLLLALGVAFMAPLFEEVFFRGFLFAGWSQSGLGILGTAILTSLLWTVIHLQYGVFELSFIFVLGLLFTFARFHTASIWTPLLMHAANNGLSLVGMALEFA